MEISPPPLPRAVPPASPPKRNLWLPLSVAVIVLGLGAYLLTSFYSPKGRLEVEMNGILDRVRAQHRDDHSGTVGAVQGFVRMVIERFSERDHQYFGQHDAVEALAKLDKAVVPLLVNKLEHEPVPEVRTVILESLTHFEGFDALPLLTKALASDPSEEVRREVATLAAEHDPQRAAPALLTGLRSDADAGVREAIASALTHLDAPVAVPALLKSLDTDTSMEVRAAAATTLGFQGDKQAIPALRLAMASTEQRLNEKAAFALAELDDHQAVPFLVAALQKEVDAIKQAKTNTASQYNYVPGDRLNTGYVQALGKLADTNAVPVLLEALTVSKDDWILRELIEALALTHDERAIPALVAHLSAGSKLAQPAADALAEIGTPTVFKSLLEFVSQPAGDKRLFAAQALGKSGQLAALPVLLEALANSPEDDIRKNSAEALGLIGDPQAVPVLITALNDRNNDVLQEVCWALGHIGEPAGAKPLLGLLQHREFGVRFSATFALAGIQDPVAIPQLKEVLHDKEDRAVLAAACSLAFHGSDAGFEELRKNLKSKESWQRFAAVLGLFRLNTPEALAQIKTRSEDPDASVRSLVNTGLEKGAPYALTELLQSGSKDFRHYAARMLPLFRDPSTVPALLAASKDSRAEVRNAARVAAVHLQRIASR